MLLKYTNGQSVTERDDWDSPTGLEEDESSSDGYGRGRDTRTMLGKSKRGMSHSLSRRGARNVSAANHGPSPASGVHEKEKGAFRVATNNRAGQPMSPLDIERNRVCPVVSPLQMLDVERIAETEMGLDEIVITENAARGIAQVAIQAFGTRLSSANHNPLPIVLVFAGNNKSGARAIAAGRHLKNHHVRVMVCVIGLDREAELLEVRTPNHFEKESY